MRPRAPKHPPALLCHWGGRAGCACVRGVGDTDRQCDEPQIWGPRQGYWGVHCAAAVAVARRLPEAVRLPVSYAPGPDASVPPEPSASGCLVTACAVPI